MSGRTIVRHRQCDIDPSHRFETEELVPLPSLSSVGVRNSGGSLSGDVFDRERLLDDVTSAILGKDSVDDDRIDRVVTRTVFVLERNLGKFLKPLLGEELTRFPRLKGSINSAIIADIVEQEMQRSSMRMQRLLYALSIRGREDRPWPGWTNASDVLTWIGSVYPRLETEIPPSQKRPHAVTWNLPETVELPQFVVKKNPRVGPRPFVYHQFEGSIRKALLGRKEPEQRSRLIATRVLGDLQGQAVVHTSQLGVGVLDSLRHLDDIAYLRWATILKRIPSVSAFTDEARELVLKPSPLVTNR